MCHDVLRCMTRDASRGICYLSNLEFTLVLYGAPLVFLLSGSVVLRVLLRVCCVSGFERENATFYPV